MNLRFIKNFIRLESFAGILLCTTALLGFILANSPLQHLYQFLLYHAFNLSFFNFPLKISINLMINDGLMVAFFLLVGLEIKREIISGELNNKRKIALPAIAALGGMVAPALIYLAINWRHPELWQGWAIPCATDIAFALAILNLLGARVPFSLKIFLTALAIFDDLGAIVIIALFYTPTLNWHYLFGAGLIEIGLIILNWRNIKSLSLYLLLGIALWFCILQSGVHATIAGVLLAFTIPLNTNLPQSSAPLKKLEQTLHPWVAFFILPLFAFANTGIPFADFQTTLLLTSLPLGIIFALLLGKQVGIMLSIVTAIKLKLSPMPPHTHWRQLYGIALLCGIGFTMSLFIATLAFKDSTLLSLARSGILTGSLLSGILGYLCLR